jgi:glycosyltransferase involved in cell wall biosynthesis
MVATPHRTPNDFNVTDFNQLQIPAGIDAFLEQPWGYGVSDARNFIVQKAIDEDIQYIFFVDDDCVIPRNALVTLFKHNVDIVGGMYYRKYFPVETVPMVETEDGTPGSYDNYKIGDVLHNCLVLPSGCTLIKTDAFKRMEAPYYKTITVQGRPTITEDTYICQRMRDIGVDIILDTSIQCLHLDLGNRKIFGHPDIVDFKNNVIKEGYENYFATQIFQKA